MNFTAIAAGDAVFIDANVFVYDFGPDAKFGPACNALLERCEKGELRGVTSSDVLHDAAHRVMTVEACQTFGWSYSGIGRRLKSNPREIQRLTRFWRMLDEIFAFGIEVLAVTAAHIVQAADISKGLGLLSGDALIVAMMHSRALTKLASADIDFDRVPGIVRYSPL